MATSSADLSSILVVDDDEVLSRTIADVLEMNGFTARTAKNGRRALAMAKEMSPSVAIVDLRLPDMDGLELASRLHADSHDLQIIILTGNASVETAIRALRDQDCDYLVKPVEPAMLVKTLRAADGRRRLRTTEDALRQSQELLHAMFDASPLPIIVVNAGLRVTLWNLAAERVFGWMPDEVVGLPLPHVSGARMAEADQRLRAVMRGETFVGLEVERVRKDGVAIELRQTLAPIRDGAGEVAGVLIVYEDITERRRLEEQLRDAQRLDQIGRLAGGVAHDFNNLLGVIIAETQMTLEGDDVAGPARDSLTNALRAAEAGSDLTKQLLAFARRRPIEPVALNPNDLVRDLERMLQRLLGARVTLRTVLDPDAGGVTADRGQLEQVITNLVMNARDAMPDGGTVTVATRRHEGTAGGAAPALDGREWVLVSVQDTGTGIPVRVRDRLFEPFFTTKPRGKGTGLGLATSHGIVERFGGVLTVESEEGRGSTFSVFLPRTGAAARAARTSGPVLGAKGSGVVVVVEDQPSLCAVARKILERHGYQVHTTGSGAEAMELLAGLAQPPDVVLLDVDLPDSDGRDIARSVRAKYPSVATILTSGTTAAMMTGSAEMPFLAKPYSLASLGAAVRSAIERKVGRRSEA